MDIVSTSILTLELIGTMAFSASGAMIALRKNMDIFGVCILGLTTAVGGGVIRDLILGNTPPATFQNSVYTTAAIATALILFLPQVRKILMQDQKLYDRVLFMMDSIGLGVFTVVGIQTAHDCIDVPPLSLLIFVGVITGVGGGVVRDMMAGDIPYIFVKHIYALASMIGAITCIILWQIIGKVAAMFLGAGTVLLVRGLSAHFRWNLPHAHI